jgi:hypothetical protein
LFELVQVSLTLSIKRKDKGMSKGKLIYETKPDRGFVFAAYELLESDRDALIEVRRDNKIVRSFTFPSYKIWNIPAHADDIINSELEKNTDGYKIAGSDGLGGNAFIDNKTLNPTQTQAQSQLEREIVGSLRRLA